MSRTVLMRSAPEETLRPFVGWEFDLIEETQRRIRLRAERAGRRIVLTMFPHDLDHFVDVETVARARRLWRATYGMGR